MNEFLACSLTIASRNANYRNIKLLSMVVGKILDEFQAVRNQAHFLVRIVIGGIIHYS